jgi:hypothetical protein
MRLNLKAFSITVALFWSGCILLIGLGNLVSGSYGAALLGVVASLYPGYHASGSLGDLIVGALYGLVDGFIGGLIFGWLYNLLTPKVQS